MGRQLRQPEEWAHDPLTGRLRLVGVFPTREFLIGEHIRTIRGRHDYDLVPNPDYPGKAGSGAFKVAYQVQQGVGLWFSVDTKQQIAAKDIPEALKAAMAVDPPTGVSAQTPSITVGTSGFAYDPQKRQPGESLAAYRARLKAGEMPLRTMEDWDDAARATGGTLEIRRPAAEKRPLGRPRKHKATPAQLAALARARAARAAAPPVEQPPVE